MIYFLSFCAVGVLGLAAVAGSGRLGEMPDPVIDHEPVSAPDIITPEVLFDTKFDVVIRGYSMEQVDALLNRIAVQMREESAEKAGVYSARD